MKKIYNVCLALCAILLTIQANAKVWRVNNTTGVAADFKEIGTAVNSNLVLAGDTIYLEGSTSSYLGFNLTKKLVIIGSGYLLNGAGSNTGLQALALNSKVSGIYLDSLGSGSTIIGISSPMYCYSSVDDLAITRCEVAIQIYSTSPNSKMQRIVINKCIGSINLQAMILEDLQVTNCILTGSVDVANAVNGLVRNNVFVSAASIGRSYISNNIFMSTLATSNSIVKYNMATGATTLPAGNNNQNGIVIGNVILNTGSADGKYMLKPGSPAIAAGEPINGVTPDIGAFGTGDPYRLSGIPAIPTIYSFTAPSSIPSSATTLNITFSTRANN